MNKNRIVIAFVAISLILFAVAAWNLSVGSVSIPVSRILSILGGDKTDISSYKVIFNIRLPRLLAALLLGGGLSVSGFLLQSFFRNPIAGPYVLGISSGAKLFVAVLLIFFLNFGIQLTSIGMVIAAFLGSLLVMGIVLLFSIKVTNMSVLIVCGILVGYICSAVTDFLVTFANDSNIVNLHNWSLGSFSGTSWSDVSLITMITVPVLVLTFIFSKPIGAFQLGENYARNMGVNIKLLRILLIVLSSILSATVTAFAGPVSFVGIAIPHLVKAVTGTAKPIILIPGCFLGGAFITLLCDGIARTVFAPTEMSISTVTAFFLVPVVIYMMLKGKGNAR